MHQTRDIIVIGASAGGVEALSSIVAQLDRDLQAAVFVVLHLPASYRSYLPGILDRAGPLLAENAEDGADIEYGRIYIAPPDFHLLLSGGSMHVARGPRVNRSRPSVDLLFQSASAAMGPRVIGVVASGMLDDGTRGLATIKRRGGATIVQSPDDASFSAMPRNAMAAAEVDHVLPAAEIGTFLNRLVADPLEEKEMVHESQPNDMLDASNGDGSNRRDISPYTCPDCNGTLWEIEEGALIHYQCRVGHSFTPSALIASQVDEVENLLWAALRAMEERESMYKMMEEKSRAAGNPLRITRMQQKLKTNSQNAELVRRILLGEEALVPATNDVDFAL